MAFQLSYEDLAGVGHTEAYWRIYPTSYNQQAKQAKAIIQAWHNQVIARTAGKSQIANEELVCSGADFDLYLEDSVLKKAGNSLLSQWYTYAKRLPRWSGSIDV